MKKFKCGVAETARFGFDATVREDDYVTTKPTTDLRLRLLSNSKLVISLNGQLSRHAHSGVPESVPFEGIPVPELGRE